MEINLSGINFSGFAQTDLIKDQVAAQVKKETEEKEKLEQQRLKVEKERLEAKLENLPVCRYPFIGSHDSASYKSGYAAGVRTQTYDFFDQYNFGGCRYFDIRLKMGKDGKLYFAHGSVFLHTVESDNSFVKLIKKCISDNSFIVFMLTDEDEKGKTNEKTTTVINFNNYIKKLTTDRVFFNHEIIEKNMWNLTETVQSYINNKKNIFITVNRFQISEWKEKFIFRPSQPTNDRLLNELKRSYNKYISDNLPVLNHLQCFYQSPFSDIAGMAISVGTYLGVSVDHAIYIEQFLLTNYTVANEIIKNNWKPNVLLFDNVNNCTLNLYKYFNTAFIIKDKKVEKINNYKYDCDKIYFDRLNSTCNVNSTIKSDYWKCSNKNLEKCCPNNKSFSGNCNYKTTACPPVSIFESGNYASGIQESYIGVL
jgi:hypothetical protein